MKIEQIITKLRQEWAQPRLPLRNDPSLPNFLLACILAEQGTTGEEWRGAVSNIPPDLRSFWAQCRKARLFADVGYGQWGLEVLSPKDAASETLELKKRRPSEVCDGDLVIGRFLGDSDLLIVRCDEKADDFGRVIVSLPLDPREDWNVVAESFGDFLEIYAKNGGEKFWEIAGDGEV